MHPFVDTAEETVGLGTLEQWVINAADPPRLARFWATVLGGSVVDRVDGWAHVDDAPGLPRLSFQPDPEPRTSPNRIHLDVRVSDLGQTTTTVVGLGATTVGEAVTDSQGAFQVVRDPEGNEFCLVTPA